MVTTDNTPTRLLNCIAPPTIQQSSNAIYVPDQAAKVDNSYRILIPSTMPPDHVDYLLDKVSKMSSKSRHSSLAVGHAIVVIESEGGGSYCH